MLLVIFRFLYLFDLIYEVVMVEEMIVVLICFWLIVRVVLVLDW